MALPAASELDDPIFDTDAPAAQGAAPEAIRAAHPRVYLSTLPPGLRERRLAIATVLVSAVAFIAAIPFAQTPLLKVPAFIPIYESALIINELITALLLIGQFVQLRSRALLVLACAYFFEALLIIPHLLSFPGVFAETGLLGAGPQTTAWLYVFWHGGFPLFVIGYAWLAARNGHSPAQAESRRASAFDTAIAFAATVAAAGVLTLVATVGKSQLPAIMVGNHYSPILVFVIGSAWLISVVAIFVLWRKPRRSALDVWLMVVMCAWVFDIGLSAVFNAGRYDLGFYAGRAYGLLAASFVLGVLLLETSGLYSRLARSTTELEGQARRLAEDVRERIAEQEKTEAQLRQAQKMEAIGNLTGGMAHDFNNLLAVIIGNLDALCEKRPQDSEVRQLAGVAVDAAMRGADLTRRLLAFARRQPLQPRRVELNELVAGIATLLERTLGQNIETRLELAPDVWPVVADPAQLESALTNLATNARDAMPNGGRLTITTGNRHLDADYAAQHADLKPGDYALVEVRDSGSGMPPELVARIFEPFFTTKEPGKGTGLGLAMVYGFMKQSHGHINVYSEAGIGTVFRLFLPRAEPAVEAETAPAPQRAMTGRGEMVLAVEDNMTLRELVARQLDELGYRVLQAENAATAMAILEGAPVDLLLTDVIMPGGTSGFELARTATARWPNLKVVFTSGFPDIKLDGGAAPVRAQFLNKPYRREELSRTLRQALEG